MSTHFIHTAPVWDPSGNSFQDSQNDVLPALTSFSSCREKTTYCIPNNNHERAEHNHSLGVLASAFIRKGCGNNLEVTINPFFSRQMEWTLVLTYHHSRTLSAGEGSTFSQHNHLPAWEQVWVDGHVQARTDLHGKRSLQRDSNFFLLPSRKCSSKCSPKNPGQSTALCVSSKYFKAAPLSQFLPRSYDKEMLDFLRCTCWTRV